MTSTLRHEIRQEKPFDSLEQEAQLAIERTAAVLGHALAEALKPYGITPTQYNALRVLRGAGANGLCQHEVRDRLLSIVPDVTRLIDRLEQGGLVIRARSTEDRRLVTTRITREGLDLLCRLDEPVAELHRRQLGHMSRAQLGMLSELLTLARKAA
jgi:DNA-binding MarR family transcriptional regulator